MSEPEIDWEPPKCSHGKIILGCPDDDCPEQNEYLAEQEKALVAYEDRMRQNAKDIVEAILYERSAGR